MTNKAYQNIRDERCFDISIHLPNQKDRQDPIGDLARDFLSTGDASPGNSPLQWEEYLRDRNACDTAIQAALLMFEELGYHLPDMDYWSINVLSKGKPDPSLTRYFMTNYITGLLDAKQSIQTYISAKYVLELEVPKLYLAIDFYPIFDMRLLHDKKLEVDFGPFKCRFKISGYDDTGPDPILVSLELESIKLKQ